uniref:Uncharacterized protein n=1 Tax=Anopheles coluzzii TaxID=1518534 RepID=A0A8W7PD44_ANOCL
MDGCVAPFRSIWRIVSMRRKHRLDSPFISSALSNRSRIFSRSSCISTHSSSAFMSSREMLASSRWMYSSRLTARFSLTRLFSYSTDSIFSSFTCLISVSSSCFSKSIRNRSCSLAALSSTHCFLRSQPRKR